VPAKYLVLFVCSGAGCCEWVRATESINNNKQRNRTIWIMARSILMIYFCNIFLKTCFLGTYQVPSIMEQEPPSPKLDVVDNVQWFVCPFIKPDTNKCGFGKSYFKELGGYHQHFYQCHSAEAAASAQVTSTNAVKKSLGQVEAAKKKSLEQEEEAAKKKSLEQGDSRGSGSSASSKETMPMIHLTDADKDHYNRITNLVWNQGWCAAQEAMEDQMIERLQRAWESGKQDGRLEQKRVMDRAMSETHDVAYVKGLIDGQMQSKSKAFPPTPDDKKENQTDKKKDDARAIDEAYMRGYARAKDVYGGLSPKEVPPPPPPRPAHPSVPAPPSVPSVPRVVSPRLKTNETQVPVKANAMRLRSRSRSKDKKQKSR